MKSKSIFFLALFLLCAFANSCKDPVNGDDPEIPTYTEEDISIIWQKNILTDSLNISSLPLKISGDKLIYASALDYEEVSTPRHGIAVYNKLTGEIAPDWPVSECGLATLTAAPIDDFAVGGTDNNILGFVDEGMYHAYSLSGQQLLWTYSENGIWPMNFINPIGKDFLIGLTKAGYSSYGSIGRLISDNGQFELIQSFDGTNGHDMNCLPMSVGYTLNENLDTLLLYTFLYWDYTEMDYSLTANCYNLTKKRVEWQKENFSTNEDPKNFLPVIHNDLVVFCCTHSMHCLDIKTGDVVWQKYFTNDNLTFTPPLLDNGRLYVQTYNGKFLCLNIENGAEIWKKNHYYCPSCISRLDMYNGLIFCTGTKVYDFDLLAISAATGEIVWRFSAPQYRFRGGVTIDPTTGLLYAMTYNKILCIDIKNIKG